MDFSLTEEQTLLQESVDRFIQNDYEFDKRQSFANSELGFSEDNWKMFGRIWEDSWVMLGSFSEVGFKLF